MLEINADLSATEQPDITKKFGNSIEPATEQEGLQKKLNYRLNVLLQSFILIIILQISF